MRVWFAAAVLVVAAGAFVGGRASVGSSHAPGSTSGYSAGYLAGREAAFDGYDGGWAYGRPYIVVLRRPSPRITYEIVRRWPMLPGVEYRACARTVCSRPR